MLKLKIQIFFATFLSLIIVVQSTLPTTLSLFNNGNYDVSAFVCNPSGTRVSDQTQRAIVSLLKSAGKDIPRPVDEGTNKDHCPDCVLVTFALDTPKIQFTLMTWANVNRVQYFETLGFFYFSQGPPLGGRAPPSFI
ncbi:MAG: hypothetical protein COA43_12675 [Robiginitomaculum sp.]|nr:MAG: hypothetical protein COA43_12675 [Robiginitomaculum sp.]